MRDHESLLAWQRAHAVVISVLRASKIHQRSYASAVFDQLQRGLRSVQLNIGEGHAAGTPAGFGYHLPVAFGSVVETIELLELLRKGVSCRGTCVTPCWRRRSRPGG